MEIPVFGFAAYSGTGKTTLIEGVIQSLTRRGIRVGVVKHDVHGFQIDQEGKDTWRFTQAGAQAALITSPAQTAVIEQRGQSLSDCLARFRDVDVILVEGFKDADIPKFGLKRMRAGKGFTAPIDEFIAVITDDPDVKTSKTRFALDDAEGVADFIIREINRMPETDFTHFDDQGRARMVDVGEKNVTRRVAVAAGRVLVNQNTFDLIRTGGMKKGDVLTVAQVAGIMGAKRTPDLIPMCHPVAISGIDLKLWLDGERLSVEIRATVKCDGRTGVEMEALAAVSAAALTVYDMCKAVQRDIVIADIRLLEKTGGIHGDYHREEKQHE